MVGTKRFVNTIKQNSARTRDANTTDSLKNTGGYSVETFHRFDDKSIRLKRMGLDKHAAIGYSFIIFIRNCETGHHLSE